MLTTKPTTKKAFDEDKKTKQLNILQRLPLSSDSTTKCVANSSPATAHQTSLPCLKDKGGRLLQVPAYLKVFKRVDQFIPGHLLQVPAYLKFFKRVDQFINSSPATIHQPVCLVCTMKVAVFSKSLLT